MALPFQFLLWLLLACAVALPAHAKRLALVIGNDNYQQVTRLEKAGNDSEAMARVLKSAGFEVSLQRDIAYRKMVEAFELFYDKVKGGDEVVIFYAGHGVQTEKGSYLLPIDIEGETQSQIEKISYSVNNVLEELDRLKARFSLVIIDACRDNPLRSRGRTIGIARGLNAPDVAKGQMVIFSAGRNQKALDSLNAADRHPNGVFTRELLSRLTQPGRSIESVAIEVKNAVEKSAATVRHEQRPLIVNDSTGEFFFFPRAGTVVAGVAISSVTPGSSDPAAVIPAIPVVSEGLGQQVAAPSVAPISAPEGLDREDRFWNDTKVADNIEAFEAYLASYPDGRYRGLARANLSRLGGRSGATASNSRGGTELPVALADAGETRTAVQTLVASVAAPRNAGTAGLAPANSAASTPPGPQPIPDTLSTPPVGSGSESSRRVAYALPNGDRYEGEAVGALRTGRGRYSFANGDIYEGDFVDNQFLGKGTFQFSNGDRYDGEVQGTTKKGHGVLVFANKDRYEGQFDDNLYHGKGSLTFANGDSYVGDFKAGLKHGKGVLTFANRDVYQGPFENDKPHGRGVIVHANGDRYEGEFRAGVKHGQGTHYFASKDRYEGMFQHGAQHGQGSHFYASGERYVGEFANGIRHGKGVYHFVAGEPKPLEFVNGIEKLP